ncbi:MAG TPA: hypothetical protein VHZ76_00225 [Gammaproteobacteria bacterium]|jgi:hypothetical protein|nr:hypothetical protein [Gammaproteobacteria bacterium]
MEFLLYVWEKSERIGLTLFLAIISLFATLYARYEANVIPSPHDLLGGTLTTPSQWLMNGMWLLTLAASLLYVGRRIWTRVSQG